MTDKQDAKVAATNVGKAGKSSTAAKSAKPAANKSAKKAPPVARAAASKSGRMVKLVVLVALLCAAYVVYSWLTSQIKNLDQSYQSQAAAQQLQASKVALMGSTIDALQNNWQQQKQALLKQQQSMDTALQQALQQMAQAQSKQQQQLPKWELAEAEYLLRLANQRLAMEQDPAAAVTLLQAADEIMRTSEQVGSYGVRQAIAKDISALLAVPMVDV